MEDEQARRAIVASRAVAIAAGPPVDDVVVLSNSNRLVARLEPSTLLVRAAPPAQRAGTQLELEIARRLAETDAPVAPLDRRIEPVLHERDGFAMTFWTYLDPVPPAELAADEYADALHRLHTAMAGVSLDGLAVPHVVERVAAARLLVEDPANDPGPWMGAADRRLVATTLAAADEVLTRGGREQLLHGEPHPGNLVRTADGLRFVDLETCCVGPVEYDLAHAAIGTDGSPLAVARHHPMADPALVRDCWALVLAVAVAWRFEPGDDLPDGPARAQTWVRTIRGLRDR